MLPEGYSETVKTDGHHAWYLPKTEDEAPVLKVFNSLTETKEPFYPKNGRKVTWYTCGPTVYDACHMGHARAYLTFDILRRIMEDYFGYEVFYQVNVTDIDDKIILRARQNKLFELYAAEKGSFEDVVKDVDRAVEARKEKLAAGKVNLEAELANAEEGARKKTTADELSAHEVKTQNFERLLPGIAAAKEAKNVAAVLHSARDPLSELLDKERGSQISDKDVFEQHARFWEGAFWEDMDALGVRPPDVITRVTEFVDEVVEFIKKLVDNGTAYEANGSVYFSTNTFQKTHDYAKLKRGGAGEATQGELAEAEGALAAGDGEKRDGRDFALWKKSKGGEPAWLSPWGMGRPGWHIECSVMATHVMGEHLDIHAGGSDLKFPHHDNELAQSEAYTGCQQWVNYFLHCGHLKIEGLKMAKSLKNFITIREALDSGLTARQLRLIFLTQAWDREMNYSEKARGAALKTEEYYQTFFANVKAFEKQFPLRSSAQTYRQCERDLAARIATLEAEVHAALCDNFDTVTAMSRLRDIAASVNTYLESEEGKKGPRMPLVLKGARFVARILRVFGVISTDRLDMGGGAGADAGGGASRQEVMEPFLDVFAKFRDDVRDKARDLKAEGKALFDLCDKVRDESLVELGVKLIDVPPDQPRPAPRLYDDPSVLKREIAEKKAIEREQKVAKIRGKIQLKKTEIDKYELAALPPSEALRKKFADEFSEWDAETGLPVKTAAGEEVSKKRLGNMKKELEKLSKENATLQGKQGGAAGFLQTFRDQLAELERQAAEAWAE
uniref:cysteine--tRNA ligase n=1 Tax=Chromera velia CCMP2878 TaxID=1169474 RepID=A0A0G4FW38_9ALVE|eukprot:Cvel_18990.t1-p1 / transcript=Cvel_18990.t1 / gene=Cvel_18990 / organism=Chromera_velia_CCMP2878 / gene_product=Cysteine--tRNA ligase, cytoplasmic, putative / transcript_product=Cysteine--tRNA ligase, cytoplasmic, putative / location=Cvel_scaffold1607:2375-8051(-) / protein_length=785 / sequence_SO=supercontig / SO=protein_coding / is_pseudo=false